MNNINYIQYNEIDSFSFGLGIVDIEKVNNKIYFSGSYTDGTSKVVIWILDDFGNIESHIITDGSASKLIYFKLNFYLFYSGTTGNTFITILNKNILTQLTTSNNGSYYDFLKTDNNIYFIHRDGLTYDLYRVSKLDDLNNLEPINFKSLLNENIEKFIKRN